MIVKEWNVSQPNRMVENYIKRFSQVGEFFEHNPFDRTEWRKRKEWLDTQQHWDRKQLIEGLLDFNREVGNYPQALSNIEKLAEPSSCVVIGGQQAGIMTGPLYAVHKAITLIQLSREMEQNLGCSVIPVFWIAGEDHDYEEVNHVYSLTPSMDRVEKIKLADLPAGRKSISHFLLPASSLVSFVEEFFALQPDSEHKRELFYRLRELADCQQTLTQFFAKVMAWLFGSYGLVLVDSAHPFVRKMGQPVFQWMIQHNERLSRSVVEQRDRIQQCCYIPQVEVSPEQAHMFVYLNGERILLERDGSNFISKDRQVRFTAEGLLQRLAEDPQQFSTNVVTRPLVQEHLFPTLAFVGGPGEISYWGLYRKIFNEIGYQMPMVYPRGSFTFVEPGIAKWLERYELSFDDVQKGLESKRKAWLIAQDETHLYEIFGGLREQIAGLYQPLLSQLDGMEKGLGDLSRKNFEKVQQQVDYLERRALAAHARRFDGDLARFLAVELSLRPLNKPQDRVLNIFSYVNKYGVSLIDQLVNERFEHNGIHKMIYL